MQNPTVTGDRTSPDARHLAARESLQIAGRRRAGRSPVVLLAEDDVATRDLVRLIIEMQGCTVIEAENGRHAVAFAEAFAGPIDLLVTDAELAALSGHAVCEAVRRYHPRIPALFISGAVPENVFPDQKLPNGTAFLPKPFTPSQFAEVFDKLVTQANHSHLVA
jgi:CheY-like chemotaxis protein